MRSISMNKFTQSLESLFKNDTEQMIDDQAPLRVKQRNGEDFVIISASDWKREQETLYVLQNKALMRQISDSLISHTIKNSL